MINKYSFGITANHNFKILFLLIFIEILPGCYSFTGGASPEWLKTIYIATVTDNSGYGDPKYRDYLTTQLVNKFKNDNTFNLVDKNGNARLDAIITNIIEAPLTIRPGAGQELESERKITVNIDAEYYDAVKKKQIWKRTFSSFGTFDISKNPQTGREKALKTALDQTADDMLLAVVSGW